MKATDSASTPARTARDDIIVKLRDLIPMNDVNTRCCERCKEPWGEHILTGTALLCPVVVKPKTPGTLERDVWKLEAKVTRLEHLGDLLAEDVVDYAGKRDLLNRLPNVKRWQKARK